MSGLLATYRPWQCNGRHSHRDVATGRVSFGGVVGSYRGGRRRTETSRTSLLPWLSVWRALRIGGSLAVSNFTATGISDSFSPTRKPG